MLTIAKLFVPFTGYPYVGEIIPCPVCGSSGRKPVATLDRRLKRLPTVMCTHCGTLYTSPMPSDAELATYYAKYYRFDYQMATTAPKQKHIVKRNREAAARIEALGGLLKPGAMILDFGCGSGEFVGGMLAAGYDAHGFEPGESYGRMAKKLYGDRVRVAGWQDVTYDRCFDLVSCFHVIEHLRDPLAALKRIASWLAEDGLAYIEVPNLAPERNRKGFGFFHFAHVIGFNHYSLLLAAALAGLVPVRIVAPTGIIFRKGTVESTESLALKGLALSNAHFMEVSAYRKYFDYQKGKLRRRAR